MRILYVRAVFCVLVLAFAACDDSGGNDDSTFQDDPVIEARLESLQVSPGTLDPAFSSLSYSYYLEVEDTVSELTVAARAASGLTLSVDGVPIDGNDYSSVITLSDDSTELTITVSSGDENSRDYILQIVKLHESAVPNWSFEYFETVDESSVPVNWTMNTSGRFLVSDTYALYGSYSGKFETLTQTIGGREVLSDPVAMQGATAVEVEAWFYLVDENDDALADDAEVSIKIYYYRDTGCLDPCENESYTKNKVALTSVNTWERVSFQRDADEIPADARFCRIAIRACYNASEGGTADDAMYVDGVSMTQD
ncbi:MAG TPA: cadherin-like beta sandwich domain-containing protein [Spirochaetota bacterium]|nr:cadherin-like beta sandwich domain-containing protein [Spirochaetota bacterium]HPI90122.1 cadherin-like beta sandwich domain-containing protein [Spirochaetota bacterium]HPR49162.1 cadherin-like beta sandwich domain-containing protein [Spirochaetota bacterium]